MAKSRIKYRLNCKNCDLDHVHETNSMDGITEFWNKWNDKPGEKMKCVHEYTIEVLS